MPLIMVENGDRDEKGHFKPGWAGGPGRPVFSLVSIIRAKLQSVPEGEKRTFAEAMIDEYLAKVRAGADGIAVRDIIDRFDGKPKQTVRVENEREGEWLELLKPIFGHAHTIEREAGIDPDELPDGQAAATDPGGGGAVGEDGVEQPAVLPPGEGEIGQG